MVYIYIVSNIPLLYTVNLYLYLALHASQIISLG